MKSNIKNMDKETIIKISEEVQKRANAYKEKLAENYNLEREIRFSECNIILAMLTGFLNNI